MADQVAALNLEPRHFQIGEPGAPCGGRSTCTDCAVAMIVRHETGRLVGARDVRAKAAPGKDPCRGLNPTEALRALTAFGVRGYRIHVNATAEDAIRATDHGVVLVAVGYNGFPTDNEAERGGKTDDAFTGPHAVTLWGRRRWTVPPKDWPKSRKFKPGWRVWTRDPDHHWGASGPAYDRFSSTYLVRAMDALVGNEGWNVRLIIAREVALPGGLRPKALGIGPHALTLEPHARTLEEIDAGAWADDLPDFGAGQNGGHS